MISRVTQARVVLPRLLAIFVITGLAGTMTGCDVEPALEPTPTAKFETPKPTSPESSSVKADEADSKLLSVIDGDTIDTTEGTVRIIGIDTPERGQCGYGEASAAIEELLSYGDPISLVLPTGQNDRDKYDRLLRYVFTIDGTDIGLMQLREGYAVARFDSVDGYPKHPREQDYRAAQTAQLDSAGQVITTQCREEAAEAISQAPSESTVGDEWWYDYPSCNQLKKNGVGHPTGPFNRDVPADAAIYEWFAYGTGYNGDGDGDGLACE